METDAVAVTQRKEALERELQRIVATLIEKYKPEKIILFGSLTTGRIHEWSDIDLLVVKETEERPLDRVRKVIATLNYPRIAVDIFIYTPQELEYLIGQGSQSIAEVFEQGKVLYERDN